MNRHVRTILAAPGIGMVHGSYQLDADALPAAESWARAEITRAKGAAEANRILADALGGPEAYLRWLFIDKLDQLDGQVIYLPTEAGMPVLEAGKRP